MLRKLLGYLLFGIGFIGIGYFRNYKGSVIAYSFIWFCVSICICVIGFYLIYRSKSAKFSKQKKSSLDRLLKLKQSGEKIILTLDNCEIRDNNYHEEVINESMSRSQVIDAAFDSNRNYKQNYVVQSAIIYYHKSGNSNIKMVSPSYPINATELKYKIDNKKGMVYIDRLDKNNYAFDVELT